MAGPTYWLNLFNYKTWQEVLRAGGTVSGFRASRWKAVQRIRPGDILLCYMTGISRFIGLMEVTSPGYRDETPIWEDEEFPCRVGVTILVQLEPETGVPILELRDRLSIFGNQDHPYAWTAHVRGSPARWSDEDGRIVAEAIQHATKNPVRRPFDRARLARKPTGTPPKVGVVTVPDDRLAHEPAEEPETERATSHTEMQYLLLKLGSDMGLDVWVARNDRSRSYGGQPFAAIDRIRHALPRQFDEATNRTIEHVDVLWLMSNSIVAAFEIESTTSIYSGLLRMSDLVSMQPNLKIPLFIVAPEERRNKVIEEINRPTFSRLSPPLSRICRYLSFVALREGARRVESHARYLRPEWIQEISESCEVEEE